jgi:gamma-glutamyltranspeptidase/glutathione hydrolase
MAGNINPNPFTTRPEIDGTFGVVTSTHWIATAVGMGTLERGGNAFEAAVATAFTLPSRRAAFERAGRRRAGAAL